MPRRHPGGSHEPGGLTHPMPDRTMVPARRWPGFDPSRPRSRPIGEGRSAWRPHCEPGKPRSPSRRRGRSWATCPRSIDGPPCRASSGWRPVWADLPDAVARPAGHPPVRARPVDDACDEDRFDKLISTPLRKVRAFTGDGLFTAWTFEPNWHKAHAILLPNFRLRRCRATCPRWSTSPSSSSPSGAGTIPTTRSTSPRT